MTITFTLREIDEAASEIVGYLKQQKSRTIAMHGEMGAGKTTLTAALLRALGGSEMASSPTFSIINHYRDGTGKPVYHMDWYRLKDEEEALNAGVEDPLFSGDWCLVEWPEKAENLLPDDALHLYIAAIEEDKRMVTLNE